MQSKKDLEQRSLLSYKLLLSVTPPPPEILALKFEYMYFSLDLNRVDYSYNDHDYPVN